MPKGLLRRVALHPRDAVAVATSAWALRRRQWWRHRPHLPVPDESYWRFRMITAFGDAERDLDVNDVIATARWSRDERRRR